MKIRRALMGCIVFSFFLVIGCELPNYKGTVQLDSRRTYDFGVLDGSFRYIYELRVGVMSNPGDTRRAAFRVPESGIYRVQNHGKSEFGTLYIYSFDDAERTTNGGNGVFVSRVDIEYSGGSDLSTEPIDVYELDDELFYEFVVVQGTRSPLVGFFDFEFWQGDRWW